jgi:predicted RND superfamily exporter protein
VPIRATLLAALALLVAAVHSIVDLRTGERRLDVDPSANRLLPEGDPARAHYDYVRRLFGSDETVVVALATDDVFSAENLERIRAIGSRIEQIEGVHHVVSLANAVNVRGVEDGLEVGPFFDEVPRDPAALAALRDEVLAHPLYGGNLVSRDGRTAALLVYLMELPEREFTRREIDHQIEAIAQEGRGAAEVWLTGAPVVKAATTRRLVSDLERTIPLTVAVMAVVLVLSFRTLSGLLIPLATVAVSVIWTLGVVARLSGALNVVTVLLPALLGTVGLSYVVYVVAEWREHIGPLAPGADRRAALAEVMRKIFLPVVVGGATTIAGFASLGLSPIPAIREFGIYSVVGVVATMLASLTVAPALLSFTRARRAAPAGSAAHARPGRFERALGWISDFDVRNRRAIFAVALGVVALSALGATRLRVGTDYMGGFKPTSPVRVGFEAVNARLEGANPFSVIVQADYSDAFKDPANLREVEKLQDWLEAQPEIGGTTSLVDYLKLINRGFHENDPAYLAVPASREETGQLFFFGGSEELERFVDSRFQIANVLVRARVIDSAEMASLIARIEARLRELPGRLTATPTGNPVLLNRALDDIMRGQAWSMVTALLLIYVMLSLMFLSPRIGLVALIPNVMPVAVYFGALGFTGITLNPSTTLVGPMALGIAVDDTIHFIDRFTREARRLADERAGAAAALLSVARPATATALSLCLGFLVLATAESQTAIQVGAMAALALAVAWLTDVFLTPALCSGVRIATLWDVLTLDLGPEPQKELPLLAGLSQRRAKLVALMSSVLDVRAGERVIRQGDRGEELYVVIDGKLRAFVEEPSGSVELRTHGRGDVIGEVGLFHATRTANVEAVSDARLLRVTQASLDRLSRRFPRTASVVHRNLNEILASRLADVTGRLRSGSAGR